MRISPGSSTSYPTIRVVPWGNQNHVLIDQEDPNQQFTSYNIRQSDPNARPRAITSAGVRPPDIHLQHHTTFQKRPVVQDPNAVHEHPFMEPLQRMNHNWRAVSAIQTQGSQRPLQVHVLPPDDLDEYPDGYNIDQEVHLLDSDGNERSGLATYIITSIAQFEEEHGLSSPPDTRCPSPFLPPDPVPPQSSAETKPYPAFPRYDHELQPGNGDQPQSASNIYTLTPATHTIFRARHSRLLPVGFHLGAEVQQHDNFVSALVIRRTVIDGIRHYDLKDELNDTWRNVPEGGLRDAHGGTFTFRTMR